MRVMSKKMMSLAVVIALVAGLAGVRVYYNGKKSVAATKSVLKQFTLSDKQLTEIVDGAQADGAKAAKVVNGLSGNDFEAAVNKVMTAYYKDGKNEEQKQFEAGVDAKASEIIKGYKEAAQERKNADNLDFETGVSLLTFGKGITQKEIKDIVKDQYGEIVYIHDCSDGTYLVKAKNYGMTAQKATKAYQDYAEITVSETNKRAYQLAEAWDMVNDPYARNEYYLQVMQVGDAWNYLRARNHSKVKVAVIDGGADMNCVDLKDNALDSSIDIYLDGTRIPLKQSSYQYNNTHGGGVAGVIGARANNGTQVAGVASCGDNSCVEIIHVKIEMYLDLIAVGLDYAREQGAKVANVSLAGGASSSMKAAIDRFNAAGGTVIAGAGNNGNADPVYPSDYDNVISVIATNEDNSRRGTSCFGWNKDISAPGTNIYTVGPGSETLIMHGTSLASPMVAGVVALMYSINPNLNATRTREIVTSTATDIGDAGRDYYFGYGLINAYRCVQAADGGSTVIDNPTTTQQQQGGNGDPVEVFGQLIQSNGDGNINVVWGSNTEMEAKGQKYNVYVDNEKKLDNVPCGNYDINGISGGTHTVKITAVYNGKETNGVTGEVQVRGGQQQTTQRDIASEIQMELSGYQMSSNIDGFGMLYSIAAPMDEVEEVGLIYALASHATKAEMVVNSSNNNVHVYAATAQGKLDRNYSNIANANSYLMTMRTIKNADFFKEKINVRIYVKLKNGQYVYSEGAWQFNVFNIADYMYREKLMKNKNAHDALYENVLHYTDSSYARVEY